MCVATTLMREFRYLYILQARDLDLQCSKLRQIVVPYIETLEWLTTSSSVPRYTYHLLSKSFR